MRKILHIFNELMPSGAETMWRASSELLSECGVETHVLATADVEGPYAEDLRAVGYQVHHVPYGRGRGYARRLCRRLWDVRCSAILVHTEQRLFTNALMARLVGARVVCVHHSEFKWTGISRLKRCVVVAILKLIGCRFVAVSESVALNERRFGHSPKVILNWIDERRFQTVEDCRDEVRHDLGLSAGATVLVTVGNCTVVKNHAFLIRMMKLLPENYVLIHIGHENEEVYGERKFAEEMGVSTRVRFMGSRSDLTRLFCACDVFVMSSVCEGLGLSCLEALYCGLPAVVGDVEGLAEIARNVRGCQACRLEEGEFAERVCEIANSPRPSIEDLRNQVKRFVSMERSVKQYLELLKV